MYATLTCVSFGILFVVVFLSTTRFMRHQIDDSVSSEIEEILAASGDRLFQGICAAVDGLSKHPSGFLYLLEDTQSVAKAGNLPAIDPQQGIREWGTTGHGAPAEYAGLRGRGLVLPAGFLFVGWRTHQLLEMQEMIVGSFAWGLAASIGLAVAGGFIMSGRLMRRIETVSTTSRTIVGDDLEQRLPVTRADDEIDHLAVSINAMLDRIADLMRDLRQVTTDIAHDLRTPLTRLRQRLELAKRAEAPASAAAATFESAVVEIDSILGIFSALLRIAQIESRSRSAGFKVIELTALLDTVAELYRPMAEEKGHLLIETLPSSLRVLGESELLMQLFANLIENALRHSPRGSTVEIEARQIHERVNVSITDNGRGIPADQRMKVLQRFYRLEVSRTTAGNGLGLSLASAIAKLHDATLELSDATPGLCVTIELPGIA